ncbi:hypothetical protein AB0C62_24750, partial [Streptomyces sp. NPDC048643]
TEDYARAVFAYRVPELSYEDVDCPAAYRPARGHRVFPCPDGTGGATKLRLIIYLYLLNRTFALRLARLTARPTDRRVEDPDP